MGGGGARGSIDVRALVHVQCSTFIASYIIVALILEVIHEVLGVCYVCILPARIGIAYEISCGREARSRVCVRGRMHGG